ncbi:hypothetical protein OHC33_003060 [Knufia fluminis]|uniref:DUF2470 domain-containing protein n=1 Tax=Knufia fluminis TaxID=191047 RepID=A0AAN8EP51_9EURO|nr:hypothetical protein OHC33_003060 [Knufia fluminis]
MATEKQGPTTLNLSDPKTQAMKTRVLNHMTNDHSDSLALYLNHYCKIPTSLRPTPPTGTLKLDDITLDHIIVSHPSGRNLIPITPPMTHLGESRERLVSMHNDCLKALDMAPFEVEKFVLLNKPWQWALTLLSLLNFVTFSLYPSAAFLPESDTLASQIWSIGGLVPQLAKLTYYVKNTVLVGMLIIHVSETVYMARGRLRRYWVPRFSGVWWAWCSVVFAGGIAGITRFDEMVGDLERERERGGKH